MQFRTRLCAISVCIAFLTIAPASAYAKDLYLEARLAAIDGNHAKCARLADQARKMDGATWHSHQVFASCTALNAQTHKDKLGPDEYETEVMTAITVLENLAAGPLVPLDQHRAQISFMAKEMRKQLIADVAQMKNRQN